MNKRRARYILTSVVLAMAAVSTMGLANVFNMSGTVTIDEAITVDPVNLTFSIGPTESVDRTITVHNISGNEVWAGVFLTIDDPLSGLWLSAVQDFLQPVAPGGQTSWDYTIHADNGVQVDEHTLTLDVFRPDDLAIQNYLNP